MFLFKAVAAFEVFTLMITLIIGVNNTRPFLVVGGLLLSNVYKDVLSCI